MRLRSPPTWNRSTSASGATRPFVALQENNAIAVIDDIAGFTGFTEASILGLGTKDHTLPFNKLDPSNLDGGINIQNLPVNGLFQPDAIASYAVGGTTYFVTANEGDGRDVDETPNRRSES